MKKPVKPKLRPSLADLCTTSVLTEVEPYSDRLDRDKEWAMDEGERFFQGTSATHKALRKITERLNELGVDYVLVGGMAMFQHGYRRFTEDVDLLVTREGLKEVHRKLDGLGYIPPFQRSKNLRDTENGVKIEFLVTGDYPGDGKPKPVSFPTPAEVAVEINGIRCIGLPALVELKLASGMSNTERAKDLSDVVEMIKVLGLPRDFAEKLKPFVQEKYSQLWHDAHPPTKRYMTLWRNKWLTADAKSVEDMIAGLQSAADTLRQMLADGVTLDPGGDTSEDYVCLVTTDQVVAKKYDMHDEREFWGEDQEQEEQAADDKSIGQRPRGPQGY